MRGARRSCFFIAKLECSMKSLHLALRDTDGQTGRRTQVHISPASAKIARQRRALLAPIGHLVVPKELDCMPSRLVPNARVSASPSPSPSSSQSRPLFLAALSSANSHKLIKKSTASSLARLPKSKSAPKARNFHKRRKV